MKQRLFVTGIILWGGMLGGSMYALWSYADRHSPPVLFADATLGDVEEFADMPLGDFESSAIHRLNTTEAKQDFDRGDAIFLDVRSAFAYEAGHIPGALHLPSHVSTAHLREVLASYPADSRVIAYCSGSGCHSSSTLAKRLVEESVRDEIYVLTGGWPAWQAAGFPVAVGEEAGS
ncbi:MAG: rhodanese-like domain-containing protein [Gemmatimonadetes bacterium]|nr:rhodanese-like domain-containing protein [Gemmatimonadota bacterium]